MTHDNFIRLDEISSFARDLQVETGRIIREARKIKNLSIVKAAELLELQPFHLKGLEDGTARQPINEIARILSFYGAGMEEFHNLDTNLLLARAVLNSKTSERGHLSLSGEVNPKPWKKMPDSLAEALQYAEESPYKFLRKSIPLYLKRVHSILSD